MTAQKPGCLYIVATPIGNLDDMTFRAVKVLKDVDIIAAEDTRHTKRLLAHFSIHTKLTAIHEHNETAKAPKIISYLQKGLNIALVSDAGTPSISDPGYKLVREVARNDIIVLPVPGCNAAIAGLSVSGLPTDSFLFIGFLPKKKNKRKDAIQNIATKKTTLILYESPKRIKTLLEELIHILGDRKACLAREISKIHEEY
ncbi:MAG: 16S rRNA (cytidine(1402)-2'-O)-methyltransferase, partial [Desulfobacteraceae bacterium]|nr:16S rRNA (cytidine(1402)-2'-O)-methyltransferase [Desulfobacteraceae bacterium]